MRRGMRLSAWTVVFVLAVLLTSSVTAGTERLPVNESKFATGPPGSVAASPEAVHQSDLVYPTFWVKSGMEKTFSAVFQNLLLFIL